MLPRPGAHGAKPAGAPAQGPPVDVSTLSEEDRVFYTRYGRLPGRKDAIKHALQGGGKHYFDSGDYALSRAGNINPRDIGTMHPSPERIPHSIPTQLRRPFPAGVSPQAPAKESNLAQGESSAAPTSE